MPPRPAPITRAVGLECNGCIFGSSFLHRHPFFIEEAQYSVRAPYVEERAEERANFLPVPGHRPQHDRLEQPIRPLGTRHVEGVTMLQQRAHNCRRVALYPSEGKAGARFEHSPGNAYGHDVAAWVRRVPFRESRTAPGEGVVGHRIDTLLLADHRVARDAERALDVVLQRLLLLLLMHELLG